MEYLLGVCGVDIQQQGLYREPAGTEHMVTPLWLAAVMGRLDIMQALLDAGADVNAGSDSGSTPLRSACFVTDEKAVRALIERGADVHRTNHRGGTCLINSVQSTQLCSFLLQCGAEVDARDAQQKTALLHAVEERRRDTVRLLLDRGADPTLRSRVGGDALQTAALVGDVDLVEMLASHPAFEFERRIDALELLGAALLDGPGLAEVCVVHWRDALEMRVLYRMPKRMSPPNDVLEDAREFNTVHELADLVDDPARLRVQALLVFERVLGGTHPETSMRAMAIGRAMVGRPDATLRLWRWALSARLADAGMLCPDSLHSAVCIARLLLLTTDSAPDSSVALAVMDALTAAIERAGRELAARPVFDRHADLYDRSLRCLTHVMHAAVSTARPHETHILMSAVRRAVLLRARAASTGDTLLHLVCSRLNVLRDLPGYEGAVSMPVPAPRFSAAVPRFPSVRCVRALLAAGADVSLVNAARGTALHVASIPHNFSSELVSSLLSAGAHFDQPNKYGDTPAALVATNPTSRLLPLEHSSLRCLAATTLVRCPQSRPLPPDLLPHTLRTFLDLHRP